MESTTMRPFCCGSIGNLIQCFKFICRIMTADIGVIDIFCGNFLNMPNLHKAYASMTKIANLINSQPELDSQQTHGAQPVRGQVTAGPS